MYVRVWGEGMRVCEGVWGRVRVCVCVCGGVCVRVCVHVGVHTACG